MAKKEKGKTGHIAITFIEENNDELNPLESTNPSGRNIYFVPFLNFLFYSAAFPYKIEFDDEENKYFAKTYKLQQVACAISHASTLFIMIYSTVLALSWVITTDDITKTAGHINIFDITSNMGLAVAAAFYIHMSWRQKQVFLELIERTRANCMSNRKLRIICILVYCCTILLIISYGVLDYLLVSHYSSLKQEKSEISADESVGNMSQGTESENEQKSFFTIFGNIYNTNESDSDVVILLKRVATVVILFLYVYITVFYSVCQSLFMIVALTLRQLGKELRRKLKAHGYDNEYNENGTDGLQLGITLYKNLKVTTELIKVVFGNAFIGYSISVVAYLAEAPYILLGKRGDQERLLMIYTVMSTILWFLAAEFHHQVKSDVLKWTDYQFDMTDLSTDNRLKILAIASEISSNETTTIALSNRCFPVTYKYLTSMIGLIVTYGVIVFQFHNGQVPLFDQ